MKILLLFKDVKDYNTINNGIILTKQWAKTIGLDIEFTSTETVKEFTSIPISNDVVTNGYVVNPVEIFQEGLQKGYVFGEDALVCLIYDWDKISPKPTNPAESGLSISIPIQWYVTYPEVFADYLLHEICHYYFAKTGKVDITHNYDPRFSQLPRKDWYLFLIKDMLKKETKVTIERFSDDGVQTLGNLSINGKYFCKTLERPWRLNQRNISCIPRGIYECRYTWSWKFMRYTYELLNVKNRTAIRIHSGNYFYDIEGCIILGDKFGDLNHDKWADIMNSRITVKAFEKAVQNLPFTLEIK